MLYDALVVGAGPAGLTAATYLGRFLRSTAVIDSGRSRAAWIPLSHNMPGFPDGATGPVLLARMRAQAEQFGARFFDGEVKTLEIFEDGFQVETSDARYQARTLLLATGVTDRLPSFLNADITVPTGVLRICPICDAYEVRDKQIAIIGDDTLGAREAAFLRTFSASVTLLHIGAAKLGVADAELEALGIDLMRIEADAIKFGDEVRVEGHDGLRVFDTAYSALGTSANNGLATSVGARCGDDGCLLVDPHQRTTITGLYAAGDVVRGLNQIAVATAEAAIAATDMHNHLARQDGQRFNQTT